MQKQKRTSNWRICRDCGCEYSPNANARVYKICPKCKSNNTQEFNKWE